MCTLECKKHHDWTQYRYLRYLIEMSDDHRYWTSGTAHRKQIRAQVETLYGMGLGKKVEVLFYKHYPVEGCHEVEGYGIEKTWQEHLDRMAVERLHIVG